MEQIRLDLIPGKSAPVCHASQYDVGRTIRLNLVEGGSEYSIPAGTTAEIHIRKPDNNIISAAVTATQGNKYIDIVTAEQWTACAGTNLCEIVLTNGGNVIGTVNFILEVEMDPIDGGSASESVIENIQGLVDAAVAQSPLTAEVEDIRNGVDGTVYPSAGDAVRGQVEDLDYAVDGLVSTVFPDVLRETVSYPFGTGLNNAYVWLSPDLYVPKGSGADLSLMNIASHVGGILHVVLLGDLGGGNFKVLKDVSVVSKLLQHMYITPLDTKDYDVYIGFYSDSKGMVHQSGTARSIDMTRFNVSDVSIGATVTPSGSYNLDFSFGLAITQSAPEPPMPQPNPFVVVDPNGDGDYTDIITAINTEPENTVIIVKPGVYVQDMTACLKKRIILIGTDRNTCIIQDPDGRYGHHPLYVSCGYFENITVTAPYISGTSQEIDVSTLGAYAVHIDTDDDYAIGKTTEFHHCTFSSDFFPAVGLGMRKDATYIFDDCEFSNGQINGRGDYSDEGTLGALYFHDSNGAQGDQFIKIKDCIFKSKLAYAMCPYQVSRNPQNNRVFCDFVNNVLYSDVGKYAGTIRFRGDPFNPDTGIFTIGIGYGNSNSGINN